jgi:hypothetical protein
MTKAHWESVYQSKATDEVSWYRPHLDVSLRLIEEAAPDRASAIIDVGGGEATLVDDLVRRGYVEAVGGRHGRRLSGLGRTGLHPRGD